MRRFSSPIAVFILVCAVAPWAAPAVADSPALERIRKSGVITFAYREHAAPFSFKAGGGRIRGYSVELCNRVAAAIEKELKLPALKIEWVPVSAATRLTTVASGKADAECGTTTMTLTRLQTVDFSVPIFVDGGSVLVRASSKVATLADLKGKRVAVIGGTTTDRGLKRALEQIDAAATVFPVQDADEGLTLLTAGKVDGYAGDRVVLAGMKNNLPASADLELINADFSFEPYALVVPRTDPDFRLAVNRALVALYRSGEIDSIFQQWLGGLGRPGPLLHSMFYLNTLPE